MLMYSLLYSCLRVELYVYNLYYLFQSFLSQLTNPQSAMSSALNNYFSQPNTPLSPLTYSINYKNSNISLNQFFSNLLITLAPLMHLYFEHFSIFSSFIYSYYYMLFFTYDKVLLNLFILDRFLIFNIISIFDFR